MPVVLDAAPFDQRFDDLTRFRQHRVILQDFDNGQPGQVAKLRREVGRKRRVVANRPLLQSRIARQTIFVVMSA